MKRLDNSYYREVVSRQRKTQGYNDCTANGSTSIFRPKTSFASNEDLIQSSDLLPVTESLDRAPTLLVNRSTSRAAFRPPTQYASRPPSQLAYRSSSQSAFRPSSRLAYHPERDYQAHRYMVTEDTIPVPGSISCDDQQIFVRKPKCTTVTPPIFRLGSHGAPWKHVRSVINSNGSHLCWIDGVVKQNENTAFPMYWNHHEPRRIIRKILTKPIINNSYSDSTSSFKRWYQDKEATKYTDLSSNTVITPVIGTSNHQEPPSSSSSSSIILPVKVQSPFLKTISDLLTPRCTTSETR